MQSELLAAIAIFAIFITFVIVGFRKKDLPEDKK